LFSLIETIEEAAQTTDIDCWLGLDHCYETWIQVMLHTERLAQSHE